MLQCEANASLAMPTAMAERGRLSTGQPSVYPAPPLNGAPQKGAPERGASSGPRRGLRVGLLPGALLGPAGRWAAGPTVSSAECVARPGDCLSGAPLSFVAVAEVRACVGAQHGGHANIVHVLRVGPTYLKSQKGHRRGRALRHPLPRRGVAKPGAPRCASPAGPAGATPGLRRGEGATSSPPLQGSEAASPPFTPVNQNGARKLRCIPGLAPMGALKASSPLHAWAGQAQRHPCASGLIGAPLTHLPRRPAAARGMCPLAADH